MRATIIDMFFYMKITIFYSRLFQNTHQNTSIINVFKIILHENDPIASVYLKYLFFYIKNGNFLKTKSDPNIHQTAPFKKNSRGEGGACPRTPLAKLMFATYKFPNQKKYFLPFPPPPGYAPVPSYDLGYKN